MLFSIVQNFLTGIKFTYFLLWSTILLTSFLSCVYMFFLAKHLFIGALFSFWGLFFQKSLHGTSVEGFTPECYLHVSSSFQSLKYKIKWLCNHKRHLFSLANRINGPTVTCLIFMRSLRVHCSVASHLPFSRKKNFYFQNMSVFPAHMYYVICIH